MENIRFIKNVIRTFAEEQSYEECFRINDKVLKPELEKEKNPTDINKLVKALGDCLSLKPKKPRKRGEEEVKRWNLKEKNWVNNKCFWFLLPMIGEYFDDFLNVIACFMGDRDFPQYNQNIFLLCRKDNSKDYATFKRLLKKGSYFLKTYQPDGFHDMFIFSINDRYLSDFEMFKHSSYSKLSPDYKAKILTFHNIRGDHSVTRVLYKDERQKKKIEEEIGISLPIDAEVASALREEMEVYNEDMKIKTTQHNGDLIEE